MTRTAIELIVTPAEGVTDAYAAASGDHNPIHVDEAFAQSVGLPGRILHGLWTMAQVARAATPAPQITADGLYSLEQLVVQFRGMGVIGPDVTVTGERDGDTVTLSAAQGDTRLIRNARATLRAEQGH